MSAFLCWLWPYLFGALLGWLAAGLLARLFRSEDPRDIEIRRLTGELDAERRRPPRTVEKVVEKLVDRQVDNPTHMTRIRQLEGEVAGIAGLRAQLAQLQAAPPKTVEKIVEKIVEKPVPDTRGLEERDRQLRECQARCAALEQQLDGPALDIAAAKAAGFNVTGPDNLEIIEGIGPKIADLLRQNGVKRFIDLARMSPAAIKAILEKGGTHFAMAAPDTWPEQAELAARNRWTALKTLQDVLVAGVRK